MDAQGAVYGLFFEPIDAPESDSDARRQLDDYFAGQRTVFDLKLVTHGPPMHEAVWKMLIEIPYGETATYGDLALRLGDATLARAVGQACAKNPIPIIIPCHRVIGSNGSLTGFGGGIEIKRELLRREASQKSLF